MLICVYVCVCACVCVCERVREIPVLSNHHNFMLIVFSSPPPSVIFFLAIFTTVFFSGDNELAWLQLAIVLLTVVPAMLLAGSPNFVYSWGKWYHRWQLSVSMVLTVALSEKWLLGEVSTTKQDEGRHRYNTAILKSRSFLTGAVCLIRCLMFIDDPVEHVLSAVLVAALGAVTSKQPVLCFCIAIASVIGAIVKFVSSLAMDRAEATGRLALLAKKHLEHDYEMQLLKTQAAMDAKQTAEASAASTKRWAAQVAHDLGTPLQGLTLAIDEAAAAHIAGVPIDQPVVVAFRTCFNSLTQLREMMMDEAKLQLGQKLLPNQDTIDPIRVLEDVRAMMDSKARAGEVALDFNLPSSPPLPHIVTDPRWLSVMTTNLVSNAIKNTRAQIRVNVHVVDATITEKVTNATTVEADRIIHAEFVKAVASSRFPTSSAKVHPALRVCVHDDGPGISPTVASRLFGMYCHGQMRDGGTGIGLHSVKVQCETLGGRCGFGTSSLLGGAVVWFEIPFRPDMMMAATADKDSSTSTTPSSSSSSSSSSASVFLASGDHKDEVYSYREAADDTCSQSRATAPVSPQVAPSVLLVDDSPIILMMVGATLVREGFTVDKATNGREGLKRMQERDYDVVISDLQMPVMDGFAMTCAVRAREAKLPGGRCQPVIVMSANTTEVDIESALATGADAFLAKPAQPAEILGAIREVLQRAGYPPTTLTRRLNAGGV